MSPPPGSVAPRGDVADEPIAWWILRRLRRPLVVGVALLVVATTGYMLIEGYGWIDALYMTVITLGTVGYSEVHPLGTGGRFFTVGVILAGFGTVVYTASILTNLFASGEAAERIRERRARKMRDSLHDHVIVAGYGRVGQAVVHSLAKMGRQCAVLDPDPEHEPSVTAAGALLVTGDATNEDDLARAGLDRAIGLVAATDRDATNLVVVLTARAARPDLRIVTRVNETRWIARMQNAGADVAQSPYDSYGASLAASSVTPAVVDLHNLPLLGLATEEIVVDASSPMLGKPIGELIESHVGVYVLGLRREQQLRRWHEVTDPIREGDIVLVLGTPAHLAALTGASR